MTLSDKIAIAPVLHDKCDKKLLGEKFTCEIKTEVLECALTSCGGEKFECDCNVYEYVSYWNKLFLYFCPKLQLIISAHFFTISMSQLVDG